MAFPGQVAELVAVCALLLAAATPSAAAAAVQRQRDTAEPLRDPCWQKEEVVVLAECAPCDRIQMKWWSVCHSTGFIQKVQCVRSEKIDFKSCISTGMEEMAFWRFEGTMMGLTVLFVLLVISRQRALDRIVSEKVRRQIESL
ncbi:protein JTB-like isoform X2 [Denticeps clupeoides]|uniref:protein JTB-like isoform X2 n=1 Tax=Denticeps clupeoides TaxID=299321 RepID=UPI0010A2B232|nr:protein JTB-like isoform X2 [Denticeps clupeoides]